MRLASTILLCQLIALPFAAAQEVRPEPPAAPAPAAPEPAAPAPAATAPVEKLQWRVRATIVDELGAPIPGAGLIQGAMDDLDVAELLARPDATADAEGVVDWTLAALLPDQFVHCHALIGAKGRACIRVRLHDQGGQRTCDLGQVVLPKGVTITGLVRDAAGKPVAGARVEAGDALAANHLKLRTSSLLFRQFFSCAISDAKGIFRLHGLQQVGATVTVRAPGYHLGRMNFVNAFQPLVVQLQAGGHVAGKVVDADGAPVPSVVDVRYEMEEEDGRWESSALDGTFRVNLDYPGRYRIWVNPSDSRAHPGVEARFSDVMAGPQSGLSIEMGKAAGGAAGAEVTVTVVDKATGDKITGCRGVAAWMPARTFQFNSSTLDTMLRSSGRKATTPGVLRLPGPSRGQPPTGRILVRSPGYAPVEIEEVAWQDEGKNEYKVEMVPESSIAGIVVDAKTGQPVAGAVIAVTEQRAPKAGRNGAIALFGGAAFATTTSVGPTRAPSGPKTDAEGRFRIGELAAGKYDLQVTHAQRPDATKQSLTLAAAEHREAIEVKIEPGVTLRGKLAGAAIGKGWRLRLRPQDRNSQFIVQMSVFGALSGAWPYEVSVAADGSFTVGGLKHGQHQVELLIPNGGNPHDVSSIELPAVHLRGGDVEQEIDLADKMPGSLTGKVQWAGAALPPGRLLLVAEPKPKQQNNVFRTSAFGFGHVRGPMTVVRPDGTYTIVAPPGSYRLVAVDLATGVRLFGAADWQQVGSGAAARLDPKIELALVRLRLEPDQGDLLVASRLQIRIEEPNQDNPLVALATSQYDSGDGLLLGPGDRELEMFLPLREVKLLVRSATHNLHDGVNRSNTPPVGETVFTPQAGKASRVEVKVETPDLAKLEKAKPAAGQILIRGR